MKDNSFDKYFDQKKLNAAQNFSFNESRWQRMDRLLDSNRADKRWRQLWLFLLIPFLFFAGFLTWGSWVFNESQRKVAQLTSEIKKLNDQLAILSSDDFNKTSNEIIYSSQDTIFHHYVVNRYDTIFKTIVYQNDLSNYSKQKEKIGSIIESYSINDSRVLSRNNSNEKILKHTSILDRSEDSTATNLLFLSDSFDSSIAHGEMADPLSEKIHTKWDIQPLYRKAIHSLSIIELMPIRKLKTSNEMGSIKHKYQWLPSFKPIILSGYELGVSGGIALSSNANNKNQSGYNIGGQGALLFGKRFKIIGAIQNLELAYKLNQVTNTSNVPVISPPSANDVFKQVEVRQPYLNYSLGLQYEFSKYRLKPYCGISALAQSMQEEKFVFVFENKVTGEDVFIRTNRNENSFHWPSLRLQAGIKYPIFENLQLALEGSYDAKISNQNWYNPLWQLKGGMIYRFIYAGR